MNEEEYQDELYYENSIDDESDLDKENYRKPVVECLKVYGIYRRDTNVIVYVGRTKRSLEIRLREHQKSSQYINKYIMNNGGFDKYSIEVLKYCDNIIDFVEWESQLILEMEPVCNIRGKYKYFT
jgi:hypothetical protein